LSDKKMKELQILSAMLLVLIFSGCVQESGTYSTTDDVPETIEYDEEVVEMLLTDDVSETIEYDGEVVEMPWGKSFDSYCAQGGGYYILKANETSYILLKTDETVAELAGKRVHATVKKITRTIPCPEGSQCPVTADWNPGEKEPDYVCTLYEMSGYTKA